MPISKRLKYSELARPPARKVLIQILPDSIQYELDKDKYKDDWIVTIGPMLHFGLGNTQKLNICR